MSNDNIILVIDDDEDIISYYKAIFKIKNINAIYISKSKDALSFFKKNKDKIKIIFLDIKLDDISGYELAPKLLKFKKVNIIAQSAYAYYEEKSKILKCGCVDFLSKPINIEKLNRILNKYYF
jgi:two-component system CheB/CheR fusion protein